jgi:putative N-acetylmannosamine-6-phosphate epimerase
MQAMNAAHKAKDTAVITNLMKGYSDIQAEVGAATKQNIRHMRNVLNHISVLIVQGMVNDPMNIKRQKQF